MVPVPVPVPVRVPGPIIALLTPVRISIPVMPAIFVQVSVMPSSSVISPSVAPVPVMPAVSVVVLTTHESTSCAVFTVRSCDNSRLNSVTCWRPGLKQSC